LRAIGLVVVVIGLCLAIIGFEPDPTQMPDPKLFFVFDKTFATPARVVHFLALVITFSGSFAFVLRFAGPLARYLSMLGRNSLNVFCVGSILSLCGSVTRFALGGSIAVDVLVLVCGLAGLGATAWLSEWREQLRVR
jgi:hypothetical protein